MLEVTKQSLALATVSADIITGLNAKKIGRGRVVHVTRNVRYLGLTPYLLWPGVSPFLWELISPVGRRGTSLQSIVVCNE